MYPFYSQLLGRLIYVIEKSYSICHLGKEERWGGYGKAIIIGEMFRARTFLDERASRRKRICT